MFGACSPPVTTDSFERAGGRGGALIDADEMLLVFEMTVIAPGQRTNLMICCEAEMDRHERSDPSAYLSPIASWSSSGVVVDLFVAFFGERNGECANGVARSRVLAASV